MIFKKHDLKFHGIPTMKSYGCGIGIFSEQVAGQSKSDLDSGLTISYIVFRA